MRATQVGSCVVITVFLVLMVQNTAVHGQVTPNEQLDQARIQQSWPTLTVKSIPAIPPAITKNEVDRYAELLDLSEGQKRYLVFHFEQYLKRCRESEETVGHAVREAALAIAAQSKPVAYPDYFHAEMALLTARAEFCMAVQSLDKELLDRIHDCLAESQKPLFQRIVLHRQRSVSLTVFGNIKIAKTKVDLSRMIESRRFGETITPDLDVVMYEYEKRLTPLRVQLDAESRKVSERYSQLKMNLQVDDHGVPWDMSKPEVAHAVQHRWQQGIIDSRKESLALQKDLAAVNDEFLPKFLAVLPHPHAENFKQAYLGRVYRRVYPDSLDPRPLYELVMAKLQQDSELHDVVVARWTEYRQVMDALNINMCKATDQWQEEGARSDTTQGWIEHDSLMSQWLRQRRDKHEEFIKWFESALPSDIVFSAQREFDMWHAHLGTEREYEREQERQGRNRYISWD